MGAPLTVQQNTQNSPENRSLSIPPEMPGKDPSAHLVPGWLVGKENGRQVPVNGKRNLPKDGGTLNRPDWGRPLPVSYTGFHTCAECQSCIYTVCVRPDRLTHQTPNPRTSAKAHPWQTLLSPTFSSTTTVEGKETTPALFWA